MKFFSILSSSVLALTFSSLVSSLAQAKYNDAKCTPEQFPGDSVEAIVVDVRDGDTVDVDIDGLIYGVRFLTVDTPESYYKGRSQGAWATQAKRFLQRALRPGDEVRVEFDREKCDMYGRILAYIRKGSTDINFEILRRGLGVNYCVYPNMSRCEQYGGAVTKAMARKWGFFADNQVELPYLWRAQMRGGIPGASYVGDIANHRIVSMSHIAKIKVANRVFFMSRRDVQAPFHFGSSVKHW